MLEHGLLAIIQVELDDAFDALFLEHCRYTDGAGASVAMSEAVSLV